MELLSGKSLEGVLIGLQHVDTLVHHFNFLLIFNYLSFLTFDFESSLGPMYPCVTRTYNPDKDECSRTYGHKNPEFPVLSLKYIAEPAQNKTD